MACGILVPWPGIEPMPNLHWKWGVLTTGLPGKSTSISFQWGYSWLLFILVGLKICFLSFFTISCAFMIVFHPSFIWSFSTNWFYNLLQRVQLSQVPEMLFLNFPLCKLSNDVAYNFVMMSSSSTEVLYSVKVLCAKGCRSYHTKGSYSPGVSLAPDESIP